MANKLIELPDFSYTSLDLDTIVEDVKALIREHPDYNNNWDDFLESNAGKMFVEITSFIVEKLAARVDWNTREMFVSTATQRQSLINILKLINHRPHLPRASKVSIHMKLTKWAPSFQLPIREEINGFDTNGNSIRFECIEMADDGKPNYDFQFSANTGTETDKITDIYNIPFYSGSTSIENDIYMEGIDNEQFALNRTPVIENSIRIYNYVGGREFIQVESFITPEAQQNETPDNIKTVPYLVEIDAQNRAIIKFGPKSLVKVPSKNDRIEVRYRVGGGSHTNIVANSINSTKTYNIEGNRTTIIFNNPNPATGGADEEDLNLAKLIAPISLRSANKTVTNEDYVSHLSRLQQVLKVSVIGKENEPKEIYEDFGYFLPSLETWIYVAPNRENWETMNPLFFNKNMMIGRPYERHGVIDYEDVHLTFDAQIVNLNKYRKYRDHAIYVTLFEDTAENTDEFGNPISLSADSFVEGIDFEIDPVRSEFHRISTADDGGNIPPDERTLRIQYVYDSTWENHRDYTIYTFIGNTITLDNQPDGIWPEWGVKIQSPDLETVYKEGIDYTINYHNNIVTRVSNGSIPMGSKVIVYYANRWQQGQNDISEEKDILSEIANKKMICVDNYIKDSKYGTFDIVATINCYKNMRSSVESGLENHIRRLYRIDRREFWDDVNKSELISYIMNFPGVRYADITYLGRDYVSYRKHSLSQISFDDMIEMGGLNVEFKIECRYNEIIVLAHDEWEGGEVFENKRHGLIFRYQDS